MRSAAELHGAGLEALVGRRLPAARKLLDQARERAVEADLVARIEASRAYLAAEHGGELDRALGLCDSALALPGVTFETAGVLHSQRALILLRMGDMPGALESFGTGIAMLTDPVELAKALSNRGGVYLAQQEGKPAAEDFARAMSLFQEAGHATGAAMVEHNLGCADLLRGDLVSALSHMDAVRPVLLPLSPVGVAISNSDRAEALLAAGMTRSALAVLDESARTFGHYRVTQRRGEVDLTIARAALASDPGRALVSARSARSRFTRTRSPALRLRADALVLGAEVRLGRTGPALIARADALAEELARIEMPWWALDLRLDAALVTIRRGDLDGARRRLSAIRVAARAPLAVRLRERDVRAALAERAGRRADALTHLRRGLAELHEWQSSFGSLDLQTMVTGHGRRLAVRGLRIASASGSPGVLFEWSERARMLASRVQPVRVPRDEQVATDLAELRTLARSEERSREMAAREAELRLQVRERAWQQQGSGAYADPTTLPALQQRLRGDRALVAHVVTGQRITALVVADATATTVDLGPREPLDALLGGLLPDLDMAAAQLPDAFARTVRAELNSRLRHLDDLLLAPLAGAVGERELVLTPSGVLAAVPWSLLATNAGRPVSVAQSATSWVTRSETPLRSATAGFVAGPRVAHAAAEIASATEVWPGARVLLGAEATAASVSDLAGAVDVLHVSAHGRHSSQNPLFSGFQLADGPWFGYDIDQLEVVPDIVLLSSCEIGRSTMRGGEELIGMTAAWLHAGVRCVLASAAAINDVVAHDVLVRVHASLAAGRPPATALADAIAGADPDGPPAPLVCFG